MTTKTNFELVQQWMRDVKQDVPDLMGLPTPAVFALRETLITEEYKEWLIEHNAMETLIQAYAQFEKMPTEEFKQEYAACMVNYLKELADMLVVIYGTFTAFGANADLVFKMVMDNNNGKVEHGEFRADGKLIVSKEVKKELKEQMLNSLDRYVRLLSDLTQPKLEGAGE